MGVLRRVLGRTLFSNSATSWHISGSRGCARTCSFCSIHTFYRAAPGKIVRTRRPKFSALRARNLATISTVSPFARELVSLVVPSTNLVDWKNEGFVADFGGGAACRPVVFFNETIGAICLILGLLTRVVAASIAIELAVITFGELTVRLGSLRGSSEEVAVSRGERPRCA